VITVERVGPTSAMSSKNTTRGLAVVCTALAAISRLIKERDSSSPAIVVRAGTRVDGECSSTATLIRR